MVLSRALVCLATLAASTFQSAAAETYSVEETVILDYRPVIARLEAGDSATARSRLQGVVTSLRIDEGAEVSAGEIVAVVTDDTIGPQIAALGSRIEGLKSQIGQSEDDLARAEQLYEEGFYPKARLDEQRTGLDVLRRNLASAQSEQNALTARRNEGRIRAPADARVTAVNVVEGSVVSPGEVIASFATLDGVVRLSLPERHAGEIEEGGGITLRLPSRAGELHTASIVKVYPELRNGAVIADAVVPGGLSALVGERVDVLAPVGERRAIRIPESFITTRYGVDFVRVRVGERFVDAPVVLASPFADPEGYVEILSGLKPGDLIEHQES